MSELPAGRHFFRDDVGYEEARAATVWNARTPQRYPDVVVQATETADVVATDPARERVSLGVMGVAALATVALLSWANAQPHVDPTAEEGPVPRCSGGAVTQAQATQQAKAAFPASEMDRFRTIASDTLGLVKADDQAAAADRATDLETAWDDDQATLQPTDCQAWTYLDEQIDPVLSAVRASSPDQTTEEAALTKLLDTLG